MESPKLPAGIIDSNFEFYEKNGKAFFLQAGQEKHFSEISIDFLTIIREDLENHPNALRAMKECGICDYKDQNEQWALCNFGNFDNKADLTVDGVIIHEHVRCQSRGSCPYEGIICLPIQARFGTITPRELEIMKLICQDLPDKLIADRISVSIHTVAIHRQNIERKIGCHSKAGIVTFAFQNHIL